MAKIALPSYLKEGNGRMEDAVLMHWKGISYMRPYKKPRDTRTSGQVAVRNAFTSLVADWGCLAGIVREAWNASVEGQDLTGYNAFIGANSNARRKGQALELCPPMGENQVMNFTAAAGTVAGSISCSFAPIPAGKHLTLFVREEVAGEENASMIRLDVGADPASPVTAPSLESGKVYTVYALVTDAAYTDAKTVSHSVSARAAAA
jgi:hypothetical protein